MSAIETNAAAANRGALPLFTAGTPSCGMNHAHENTDETYNRRWLESIARERASRSVRVRPVESPCCWTLDRPAVKSDYRFFLDDFAPALVAFVAVVFLVVFFFVAAM